MLTAKERLLQTLVEYIKKGEDLQSIALSKIAQDADIGKSTVYEYFESKEQLIIETYRHLLKHYEKILLADLSVMDFKGALLEELKRTLVVMKDARSIMEAIMNAPHHQGVRIDLELKDEINAIQKAMEERFSSIMYLGVVEGIYPMREPRKETPFLIRALISGLMFQFINGETPFSEEELLELLYQEIVRIVKY
jgi:AcrR family transcriptional regulator